jgi:hypothetical protein
MKVLRGELPPIDTSEAFRPGSPHWGSMVSPTAEVIADVIGRDVA